MTELVLPEHTNALGTIFGGQIMAWIDTAAAICAFRHCRSMCVTASMDALDFINPVKLGHIVILNANINFTGKTSMEIGVKVTSENPLTGQKSHTASSYLTFVAIDGNGNAIPVPPVNPQTEQEKKWFEEGKARRAARLALKATKK
ncbi:acyl-CoA thioesterase [bacterium]|nr:acyl-CoA thioesterase [bacterium]